MMKKIALLSTGIFEFLHYLRWLGCHKLEDRFHYSAFDLKLRIEEATNNDGGIPLTIVRAFHNKVIGTIIDIYSELLRYFDILFLVNFLSPLGVFYFFCGLYYGARKLKKRIYIGLLALLLLIPLIEILFMPSMSFPVKGAALMLPFTLFSLYGVWQFFSENNRRVIRFVVFLIMLGLSVLWYVVFPKEIFHFCMPK